MVALPAGYSTDKMVGYEMLVASMERHGLTPVGVQNHGRQIVDALNADYPGLRVYLSPTDSPVWPGFGSLDVTIDSGLGGWEFRDDGYFAYEPAKAAAWEAAHGQPTPAPEPGPTPAPPAPIPPADPGVLEVIKQFYVFEEMRHAEILQHFDRVHREHAAIVAAQAGGYTGQVKIPYLGTVTINLWPVKK